MGKRSWARLMVKSCSCILTLFTMLDHYSSYLVANVLLEEICPKTSCLHVPMVETALEITLVDDDEEDDV